MRKTECLIEAPVRMKTAQLQAAQANGQSISNAERELLKGKFVTRSYASCLEPTDSYLSLVEAE